MSQKNLPAIIPAATPQLAKSLSPQDLEDHRGKLAFEVKIVLSAYFQPHEEDAIKTAQLAWWCDELEDWKHDQVVWGLRKWNRENPRKRPTPGDIVRLLKDARGRKLAVDRAEVQEAYTAPITDEEKAERAASAKRIMDGVGFKIQRAQNIDLEGKTDGN